MTPHNNGFRVVSGNRCCFIWQLGIESMELQCESVDLSYWKEYFNLSFDYTCVINSIQHSNDMYLKQAEVFSRGIRILKQDKFETLISFILSQRSSIPKIASMISNISLVLGERFNGYNGFPEPKEIYDKMDKISSLGLGYRDKYIIDASRQVLEKGIEYFNTVEKLKEIYGVGDKVANCYMLFALNDYESFPIDVWIQRIIDTYYCGNFVLADDLIEYAGIVQQFMFYYERSK